MSVPAGPDDRLPAYLEEIAANLHGPRHRRQQILAELGDGLEQAVAGHAEAGLSPDRSVTAAIEEFGDPRVVADGFAAELAIAYARRTLVAFIATGPLVGVWWLLALRPHPWPAVPTALLAAVPILPVVAVAIAAAAGTVAGTGRLMRWLPEVGPRGALDATVAVAVLALACDMVVLGGYARSAATVQPPAVAAIAASLIRMACSGYTVHRATAVRRRL
jgi:hypothetical protein